MKTIEYTLSKEINTLMYNSGTDTSTFRPLCFVLQATSSSNYHHSLLEWIILVLQRMGILCCLVETTSIPSPSELYPISSSSSTTSTTNTNNLCRSPNSNNNSATRTNINSTSNSIQYVHYIVIFSTNTASRIESMLHSLLNTILKIHHHDSEYAIEKSSGYQQYCNKYNIPFDTTSIIHDDKAIIFHEADIVALNVNIDELFTTTIRNYIYAYLLRHDWCLIGNSNLFVYGMKMNIDKSLTIDNSTSNDISTCKLLSKYTNDGISIHDAVQLSVMIEKHNPTRSTILSSSVSSFVWKVRLQIQPHVFRIRHITPELLQERDKFRIFPFSSNIPTINETGIPNAVPLPLQTKGDTDNLHIYALPSLIPATIESIDMGDHKDTSTTVTSLPVSKPSKSSKNNSKSNIISPVTSPVSNNHYLYSLLGYRISAPDVVHNQPLATLLTNPVALHQIVHTNATNNATSSAITNHWDSHNITDYNTLANLPRTKLPLALCVTDIIPLRWLGRIRESIITNNIQNIYGNDSLPTVSTCMSCITDINKCGMDSLIDDILTNTTLSQTSLYSSMVPLLSMNNISDGMAESIVDVEVTENITKVGTSPSSHLNTSIDTIQQISPIQNSVSTRSISTSLFSSALTILRTSNSSSIPNAVSSSTNVDHKGKFIPPKLLSKPSVPFPSSLFTTASTICKVSSVSNPSTTIEPIKSQAQLPLGKKVGFTLVPGGSLYQRVTNHDNDEKSVNTTAKLSPTTNDNNMIVNPVKSTMNPLMKWLCNQPLSTPIEWSNTTIPIQRIHYISIGTIITRLSPIHDRELVSLPSQYAMLGQYNNLSLSDIIQHPNLINTSIPYQSPLTTGYANHCTVLTSQLEGLSHIRQNVQPYPLSIRETTDEDHARELFEANLRYATDTEMDSNYNNTTIPDISSSTKGIDTVPEFNIVDIGDTEGDSMIEHSNIHGTSVATKSFAAPNTSTSTGKRKASNESTGKSTKVPKQTKASNPSTTITEGESNNPSVPPTATVPTEDMTELANRITEIGANETLLRTASYKQGGCELKHLKAYLRTVANLPVTGNKNQLVDRVLEYMQRTK